MVQHPQHLSALTGKEIATFASLLSLPPRLLDAETGSPTDLWLAAQARHSAALPEPLLRPHNWLARLSMTAGRHLQQSRLPALEDLVPQCAVLCPAHRGLNPWVVRCAFFLVSWEATAGTSALWRYLAHPGRYRCRAKKLEDDDAVDVGEVRAFVDRLAGVVALWTERPAAVDRRVGDVVRRPKIRSECEACIVAAVGADAQALCDLRAGLLGRIHRGRRGNNSSSRRQREPVLLRLVEAWIARFEGGGEELMRESERLGKVFKRVRQAVHDRKRRGGKSSHGHGSHGASSKSGSRGGSSKAGGSHGKQPSASSLSIHTVLRPLNSGSSFFIPSRHHHRGRHSDNATRLASVNDDNPLPQNPSYHSSNANTNEDIIDLYGGGTGAEEDDDGFDEPDPRAVEQLQHDASRWYGAVGDVDEQHATFPQSATDTKASWPALATTTRIARPAVTTTKKPSVNKPAAAPTMPFSDDKDEDDFDSAQWTDVSVPTLATRSGPNTARQKSSPAAMVPLLHRAPFVMSLVGSRVDDVTSSLYSQDGTAMPHPPASTVFRPELRPVTPGSKFVDPRAAPPVPTQRGQTSQVTAWSDSNYHHGLQTTITAANSRHRHRHRRTPSSSSSPTSSSRRCPERVITASTNPSADEFRSGFYRLSLDDPVCSSSSSTSSHIPEGTLLPGESVSVVGEIRPSYPRGDARVVQGGGAGAITAAAGVHVHVHVRERGGKRRRR